jgi:hypothetical protein
MPAQFSAGPLVVVAGVQPLVDWTTSDGYGGSYAPGSP